MGMMCSRHIFITFFSDSFWKQIWYSFLASRIQNLIHFMVITTYEDVQDGMRWSNCCWKGLFDLSRYHKKCVWCRFDGWKLYHWLLCQMWSSAGSMNNDNRIYSTWTKAFCIYTLLLAHLFIKTSMNFLMVYLISRIYILQKLPYSSSRIDKFYSIYINVLCCTIYKWNMSQISA